MRARAAQVGGRGPDEPEAQARGRDVPALALGACVRRGFTLVEMLVVMAALAMATGLLAIAMVGALRLERASMGALDRFGAQRELADRFRADVAGAADAPARWEENVAGPTCLVLRLGADRHVVYRWDTKRLLRAESVGDTTYRHEVARDLHPAAVVFERSGDGGRLLTLRLFTAGKDGGKHPSAEIAAALGGDLQ